MPVLACGIVKRVARAVIAENDELRARARSRRQAYEVEIGEPLELVDDPLALQVAHLLVGPLCPRAADRQLRRQA